MSARQTKASAGPAATLAIVQCPIATLKPFAGNARTHSPAQIAKLAASIAQFGFVVPILIDADSNIVAGHGRVLAAKTLGLTEAPAIRIDHLSEAQLRAYRLADNRLAELAGWDEAMLRLEFQFLAETALDFSIELTGFSTSDIDLVLDGPVASAIDPKADAFLAPSKGPAVTQPGDLWRLGEHLLLCGDARNREHYALLMGEERARMVFTDPPYNVAIDGNVCGKGAIKHAEFIMAAGELSAAEFTRFLADACAAMADYAVDGSIHFHCMDWRHLRELLDAAAPVYGPPKNLIAWVKDNAGMGSFYRSQHELVFAFKKGEAKHINNFGLGENGRYRTNVWRYPGVNAGGAARRAELAMHPTVKPVALVADAIRDVSRRGDIVLDPFGGSGTTLIAAHKTHRRARLLELDPAYCDVIVQRFQRFTKTDAVHAGSGKTFNQRLEDLGVSHAEGEDHAE